VVEIVHPVPVEEIPRWAVPLAVSLLQTSSGDRFDEWTKRRAAGWERAWGARDAGRWVGTLATERRRLTVPAGTEGTHDLEVDALTAASVAATHRRRGLLSTMVRQAMAEAAERGDPLSMLVAAEWPIYGRFGYAPATDLVEYRLRPRRPRALLEPPTPGSVSMLDIDEIAGIAPSLFERARHLRAGQVDRPDPWWPQHFGRDGHKASTPPGTWVVHNGADGVDGMLEWSVTRDFDLADNLGAIKVNDLVATTPQAYRDLWSYLCGIDAVAEIALPDRPVDEAIRWLVHDGRALQARNLADELWVRLLDVPAALSARGYSRPGSVVLEVIDTAPSGYAAGRFRLDAADDAATCSPTTDSPDLRIDQRALAAIYLGGRRLAVLAAALQIEELTTGARDVVDAMFATPVAPWSQTGF
jgi:predicted acetyltransferase